jgi:peptidoglycan DL-endopeptidase CwlO
VTRRNPIRRAVRLDCSVPIGSSGPRLAALLLSLAASVLVVGGASADPSEIAGKQAEAQRVLAQIRQLDSDVAHAAEAYNLATLQLDRIKADQRRNSFLLRIARSNFRRANALLEQRLVAIYTTEAATGSTLEVVLGARSLSDLLSRIDTAERVSAQDGEVLGQVRRFRGEMRQRKRALGRANARQTRIVRERAARKAEIGRRLAERRRLLGTIRDQIARLEAAERARQAALQRAAQARLAAERRTAAAATTAQAAAPVAPVSPLEPAAAAPPAARYGGVVGIAMRYLGVPYRWGGASPSGFDCSGFVMYVFAQVGVSLPHSTYALWGMGAAVSRSQLQPGDLVFFNGLGHMGIYIGGNSMIHAPHTGDVVKISSLSGWYSSTYVGARRITG